MHQLFKQLATASLAVYLTGWFCIIPVLVLCTCADGHAAFTMQGHDEPACDHQASGHGHAHSHTSSDLKDSKDSPSSDQHQDHEDNQSPFGELLASSTNQTMTFLAPICIGMIDTVADSSSKFADYNRSNRPHGPPENVRASITSTILLI